MLRQIEDLILEEIIIKELNENKEKPHISKSIKTQSCSSDSSLDTNSNASINITSLKDRSIALHVKLGTIAETSKIDELKRCYTESKLILDNCIKQEEKQHVQQLIEKDTSKEKLKKDSKTNNQKNNSQLDDQQSNSSNGSIDKKMKKSSLSSSKIVHKDERKEKNKELSNKFPNFRSVSQDHVRANNQSIVQQRSSTAIFLQESDRLKSKDEFKFMSESNVNSIQLEKNRRYQQTTKNPSKNSNDQLQNASSSPERPLSPATIKSCMKQTTTSKMTSTQSSTQTNHDNIKDQISRSITELSKQMVHDKETHDIVSKGGLLAEPQEFLKCIEKLIKSTDAVEKHLENVQKLNKEFFDFEKQDLKLNAIKQTLESLAAALKTCISHKRAILEKADKDTSKSIMKSLQSLTKQHQNVVSKYKEKNAIYLKNYDKWIQFHKDYKKIDLWLDQTLTKVNELNSSNLDDNQTLEIIKVNLKKTVSLF